MKITFFAVALFGTAVSLAAQTLKPEDLWKLGRVSDPQVSPDGKEVLYNIRNYDLGANKGNSDIWKVNVASGNAIALSAGPSNESSAKWSRDGQTVYFLDDQGGASTLWSMKPD